MYNDNYLAHYGVLGMKWGKRRYTNPDGSLNALGKKRREMKDAKKDDREARAEYARAAREHDAFREAGWTSRKSDMRLGDAARASAEARIKYRQAKKEFKDLKKQTVAELKNSQTVTRGRVIAGNIASTALGAGIATAAGYAFVVRLGKEIIDG